MEKKLEEIISMRLFRILGNTRQSEQKLVEHYCQLYPPVITSTMSLREKNVRKSIGKHNELCNTIRAVVGYLVENGYLLKENIVTTGGTTQVLFYQTNNTRLLFESRRFQT